MEQQQKQRSNQKTAQLIQGDQQQIDDEQPGPFPVEKLQSSGIASVDIKKLKMLASAPWNMLCTLLGRSFSRSKGSAKLSLIRSSKQSSTATKLVPLGFTNASQLHAQRLEIIQITTGSRELDQILEGGIETGSITEIYGEFRSGKKQFCHTLCVTCQLPLDRGGGEGKALYIDAEGAFRSQRLLQIADRYSLNVPDVHENVAYARTYNTDHQSCFLLEVASMMVETRHLFHVHASFPEFEINFYL